MQIPRTKGRRLLGLTKYWLKNYFFGGKGKKIGTEVIRVDRSHSLENVNLMKVIRG